MEVQADPVALLHKARMRWQVAQLMLEGVEEGRYTLLFPDLTSTAVTATLGGVAPLSLPLWLAAPVAFFTVSLMQYILRISLAHMGLPVALRACTTVCGRCWPSSCSFCHSLSAHS